MDPISTSIGLSLVSKSQPETLEQWNARYEAMSLEQDWWFRAGTAAIRFVRTVATRAAEPTATPAFRAAHA
jgi:hypothetical protein